MTESKEQASTLMSPPYFYQVQQLDEGIDLRDLLKVLWKGKWWIFICIILGGIFGSIYALLQPNIYESQVLIAPAFSEQSEAGSLLKNQLGGLASLAGINLGNSGTSKTTLALEVLKSRKFIGDFIKRHNLLVPLMAINGWNDKKDKWKYDTSKYNAKDKYWLNINGKTLKPTILDATHYFIKHVMVINRNKENGMTTVSIYFYSPNVAKQWADWLIADLNEDMRQQDMHDAQNSIRYLNEQISKTSVSDNRKMLYQLIEQQTKILMLTKVRKEYVFKTIDPAIVAEVPAKPKRKIIIITVMLLGLIFGVIVIFIKKLFLDQN